MKRALSLCAGVWLAAAAATPALAGYQAGMEAYKDGDLKRAIDEFQVEVQKHPGFDYGHFMLGVCYLKQKEYDTAIGWFRKAIEIDDSQLKYHANLAQVYAEQGRWSDVVAALEGKTNLSAEPEVSAQASFLLGFGYFTIGQYGKAAGELAAARKVRPNEIRILSALGTAQFLSGRIDEAVESLRAAVKINPRQGAANQYLGEAYLAKAQRETDTKEREALCASAIRHAEAAAQAHAQPDFNALNLLARAHLGANRYKQAVEAFDRALALNPDHGYAHFNKGQALKGLGEWAGAEKEYRRAVALLPGNPEALVALAYCYEQLARQGDGANLDKALSFYQKTQALKPSPATRDAIARVQEEIRLRSSTSR